MMTQLWGCSEEPEISTATLKGYVTESPKGTEPIAGVTVSLQPGGMSITTGSDGSYSFSGVQPGAYSLQYMKSGYQTETRAVTLVAGDNKSLDVQLKKEIEEAQITITPSSLNFGTMLTEQNVTIKNNGNATAEWSLVFGNYNWLSASQMRGSIQAGRTQSITFSVNRNYILEPTNIIANIEAYGDSYPISISCAPKTAKSEMVIEPKTLDFGKTLSQLTFTIKNVGTSALTWISGDVPESISLSATQGEVAPGGSKVVIVNLDRDKLEGDLASHIIISDLISEETIEIKAVKVEESNLTITPSTIDFGDDLSQQTLLIQNDGKGSVDWTTKEVVSALTLVPSAGTLSGGASTTVTVSLDRNKIEKDFDSSFVISAGGNDYTVKAIAKNNTGGNPPGSSDELRVTTYPAANIAETSAEVRGEVELLSKNVIIEYGFCYGTTSDTPIMTAVKRVSLVVTELTPGKFSTDLWELKPDQKYYYKAYAIDAFNEVYYGETLSFETIGTGDASITLLSAKMGKVDENYNFILRATASINPAGKEIAEAGFLYRGDGYDVSYSGYGGTEKIVCDIVDNTISCNEQIKLRAGVDFVYIRAYIKLVNGLIVYNGKKEYISMDMPWPREDW
ncbi:MAG: carboxypeptidase regulatory-like domain-containing protein [Muribaculaceae bacterium]|nr:carboxypeptidase regulatory-like domain-containing protein [Muribaculaceae bacterium]